MTSTLPYRKNVAAFILNTSGDIFCCQRADGFTDWQLPQGGIDPGETPTEAVAREIKEEVGLQAFEILGKLSQTISYEWPKELHKRGYRGQEQHFFIVRANPDWKPRFNLGPEIEFKAFQWVNREKFEILVSGTLREASYIQAVRLIEKEYPHLLHEEGNT